MYTHVYITHPVSLSLSPSLQLVSAVRLAPPVTSAPHTEDSAAAEKGSQDSAVTFAPLGMVVPTASVSRKNFHRFL